MMHMKAMKIKLAEKLVRIKDMQLAEMMRLSEIIIFTNDPCGYNYARTK